MKDARRPLLHRNLASNAVGSTFEKHLLGAANQERASSLSQVVVLDRHDGIVSRKGAGDPLFLKACKSCGLLVAHLKAPVPLFPGTASPFFRYAYVPLADHDSQCRP